MWVRNPHLAPRRRAARDPFSLSLRNSVSPINTAFERRAIPTCKRRALHLRAVDEFAQRAIRIVRGPDGFIRQDELLELLVIKAAAGLTAIASNPGGAGTGACVERRRLHRSAARPEAVADHLVRACPLA